MLYDIAILGLRIAIAVVFISSGWRNLTDTRQRSVSLGLPPFVTAFLGTVYLISSVSLILGIYIQIVSAILIIPMIVGLYKKFFIWKPGIWGDHKYDGWHYNVLFIFCLLLFIADSGRFVLLPNF
jgi:uncharacterized membrane protein YphA (DoxX/SURF4 family)